LKDNDGEIIVTVFADSSWNPEKKKRLLRRLQIGYGLNENLKPFLRLAQSVPQIKAAIRAMRGMRMSCPESLFEISVISLLLQNTTIKRSIQMTKNLFERYGSKVSFDGQNLFCFFSPGDILKATEEELRLLCRLGYRAKYLPRFAAFFLNEDDDKLREMPPHEILSRLQTIHGVGPYTANIIASHALRDTQAIALDVWNRKLLAKFLLNIDDADPKIIRKTCGKLFHHYAGLAALYLIEDYYRTMPMSSLALSKQSRK
jgi:3-methyladenine DNA glycosylase/8-oxoguanine DNA glycosylase